MFLERETCPSASALSNRSPHHPHSSRTPWHKQAVRPHWWQIVIDTERRSVTVSRCGRLILAAHFTGRP
jgi:hypothetical protein